MKPPPHLELSDDARGSYAGRRCTGMRFLVVHAVLLAVLMGCSTVPLSNDVEFSLSSEEPVMSTSAENTSGWLATAGGASGERITSMIPLSNGTMVVAGWFEQTIEFHGDVVGFSSEDSSFGVDFFVGYIDEAGNWTYTVNGTSVGMDAVSSMAQLSDGTLLLAGTYCEMTQAGNCNLTLGALDPINKSAEDHENGVFLAAMSPTGDWLWAKSYSNPYQLMVVDLLVTQSDEIHLALLHRGELTIDNLSSPASVTAEAVALVEMNAQGDVSALSTVFSSNALDVTGSLCKDNAGMTYFATSFTDIIVFGQEEINSSGGLNIAVGQYADGAWNWVSHAGGQDDTTVAACSGRPGGGVSVVGDYMQDLTFGTHQVDNAVWVDFYEAHLSSDGTWLHATGFGGSGADRAVGILVNDQGDSIVLGETTGSITLGEFTLSDLDGVNDGNHFDVFLAQRQANGPWDWAISGGGTGNDLATALSTSASGSPVVAFASNADASFGMHAFDQRDQTDIGVWLYETDLDLDGVLDGADNCPKVANVDQANHDGDAYGDVCDDDDDGDGVNDLNDDCPDGDVGWSANALSDHDGDGCRDLTEDLDDDEDGIFDTYDLCPKGPVGWISDEENDIEQDGCADIDSDGDGFVDQADNCPAVANPTQADLDNDLVGDLCDADKDGDGISIPDDNCPNDLNAWISFSWNDYDEDGCLDETIDEDDDDDGVLDVDDDCPYGEKNWIDQATSMDHDGDGCADSTEDEDDDNDGVEDGVDRCPKGIIGVAQAGQDMDGDGCIDAVEDDDDDQDGVLDPLDECPRSDPADQISSNGCSQFQLDDDNDGVVNAYDFCLNSAANAIVDQQGCDTTNIAPSGDADEGGWGIAGWLFLLAGAVVVWAVYTNSQRPGPPLEPIVKIPPPRPASMDEEA